MAVFALRLLEILVVVQFVYSANVENDPGLDKRILMLEKKLEQQELANVRLGETVRHLELKCQLQERTSARQSERNTLQHDRIKQAENDIRLLEENVFKSCSCKTDVNVPTNASVQPERQEKAYLPPALNRVTRQSETVAFSAYADHNLKNLGIDHPIVYNRVLLNAGGAYNENSGMFTCPQDGIYVFYFSVSTQDINQIVAKLVVDGVNEVDGVSDTFHDNHEAQGANLVVTSLQTGQQVWIANYRWTTHSMQESDIYRFSTFSGFLLY